jgi:hypothetical protein
MVSGEAQGHRCCAVESRRSGWARTSRWSSASTDCKTVLVRLGGLTGIRNIRLNAQGWGRALPICVSAPPMLSSTYGLLDFGISTAVRGRKMEGAIRTVDSMSRHFFGKALLITGATFLSITPSWSEPIWTVVGTGTANQFSGQNFLINPGPGGEVNKLGTTTELGLYVQGSKPTNTVFDPMYLILGFVNENTTFKAPTITGETVYNSAGNPGSGGIINAGSPSATFSTTINAMSAVPAGVDGGTGKSGLPADWTGSPTVVYNFLGLGGNTGGSESFGNWQTAEADLSTPINASNFLIAVYDLSQFTDNSNFTASGLIDVTFNGTLPVGTMAVGYACQGGTTTLCSNNPNPFTNPFTQSGITTGGGNQVPEPSSILLLGTVSLILARIGRKKLQRS